MRAVIYARISRDATGEAAGVERQVKQCTLLAGAREYEIIREPLVDNDISAYSGVRRPAYEKLMGMIGRREVDVVIVWHMDRLCRRVADLVGLLKLAVDTGVRIATVHGDLDLSSAIGRMFATILIAIAEYEAAHKGERQVAAAQAAAKAGKRRTTCPRPFGYQADHVTRDPDEAEALEAGYRMILAGGTLAGVMREWTKLGVRPTQNSGRPWSPNSVKGILLNPVNAGLVTYKGEIVSSEGKHEAIVSEETWRRVGAILTDDSRPRTRGTRTLLGGLARCRCGNVVTGARKTDGPAVYRCEQLTRDGREGPHVAMRSDRVDEYVVSVICARLARADAADLVASVERSDIDVVALQEEALGIRGNLDELAADRALGLVSRSQMIAATERGEDRLKVISDRLADAARESVFADLIGSGDVCAVWKRLDLSRKRAILSVLMTVTLHPAGRGARVFDPETVQVEWRDAGS
jgi:site-specific DNA recombinase